MVGMEKSSSGPSVPARPGFHSPSTWVDRIQRMSRVREDFGMKIVSVLSTVAALGVAGVFLSGCPNGCQNPPQLITTPVGVSVATLVKTTGFVDTSHNCNPAVPPAPD